MLVLVGLIYLTVNLSANTNCKDTKVNTFQVAGRAEAESNYSWSTTRYKMECNDQGREWKWEKLTGNHSLESRLQTLEKENRRDNTTDFRKSARYTYNI